MKAEDILEALRVAQRTGTSVTTETLDAYGLGGVDCAVCHNTGSVCYEKDGYLYSRECECMKKRRSLRRIRNSGMADMLLRCTMENYQTPDETRRNIKRKAEAFVVDETGWFYIAGRSGSGKTHICTAICSRLMDRNREVYYMSWRDESTALKGSITDKGEYEPRVGRLKRVPVLYIDDFLKGGATGADIRLAFEIINARYMDSGLRTILSSELDIAQVLDLDEALGGRIYERSRGFVLKAPEENWRLRA